MGRDTLAWEALAQIPKILTLMDRNAHSPTYGCFDRAHWHYKIIDFPSGMAQEFVWPLALAYHTDVEGNQFHRQPAIRTWVEAGIRFAARSSHPDGSCDDYFPFERAAGAAAFSLLACLESFELMELDAPELLEFFSRRADWLARHRESGRLANHVALTVLALTRLGTMLDTGRWDGARDELLEVLLSWQDDEGWFAEYEGFDPGYHTLTVSCLAARGCGRRSSARSGWPSTSSTRTARSAASTVAATPTASSRTGSSWSAAGCPRRWPSTTGRSRRWRRAWLPAMPTTASSAITPGTSCWHGGTGWTSGHRRRHGAMAGVISPTQGFWSTGATASSSSSPSTRAGSSHSSRTASSWPPTPSSRC